MALKSSTPKTKFVRIIDSAQKGTKNLEDAFKEYILVLLCLHKYASWRKTSMFFRLQRLWLFQRQHILRTEHFGRNWKPTESNLGVKKSRLCFLQTSRRHLADDQ